MIPYLLLLSIPSLFSLFNTRRMSLLLWGMTFFIFLIFVGLRDAVGPDWLQYGAIHTMIGYYDFWEIAVQSEPLSHLLFWVSENMGLHTYLSNFVAAFLMLLGVFCFARQTLNPWLALTSATPYFIIVCGMSGIRQVMAAGIVLFLLSRWERYSLIRRGIYIMVAAMFHTSALANNILLITKLNIPMRYKIVIGGLIAMATLYLTSEVSMYSDSMIEYRQRYLESNSPIQSIGSLYHIALIAIPAFLGFIYKKRIRDTHQNMQLLNFGLYASLTVLVLNFFSSTAASRLTIYLYFVPMIVYPALSQTFGQRANLLTIFSIIMFHVLILVTWFSFGNVAFAYIPYNNLLFNE